MAEKRPSEHRALGMLGTLSKSRCTVEHRRARRRKDGAWAADLPPMEKGLARVKRLEARPAKVGDFDLAAVIDEEILRLQVAMQHRRVQGVQVVHASRNVRAHLEAERVLSWSQQHIAQVAASTVVQQCMQRAHKELGDDAQRWPGCHLDQLYDVWMTKLAEQHGLALGAWRRQA